jgi:hypothetical protein
MVDNAVATKRQRTYYQQADVEKFNENESDLQDEGSIKLIQLENLDFEVKKASADNKYLMIFDKS